MVQAEQVQDRRLDVVNADARLDGIRVGDRLDGAAEPTMSAPTTAKGRALSGMPVKQRTLLKQQDD